MSGPPGAVAAAGGGGGGAGGGAPAARAGAHERALASPPLARFGGVRVRAGPTSSDAGDLTVHADRLEWRGGGHAGASVGGVGGQTAAATESIYLADITALFVRRAEAQLKVVSGGGRAGGVVFAFMSAAGAADAKAAVAALDSIQVARARCAAPPAGGGGARGAPGGAALGAGAPPVVRAFAGALRSAGGGAAADAAARAGALADAGWGAAAAAAAEGALSSGEALSTRAPSVPRLRAAGTADVGLPSYIEPPDMNEESYTRSITLTALSIRQARRCPPPHVPPPSSLCSADMRPRTTAAPPTPSLVAP